MSFMTVKSPTADIRYIVAACVISLGLLVGAWIFQYGFGYAPCQMCYWQRYAHMAVIAASLGLLFISRMAGLSPRIGALILVVLLLGSAGLGAFHAGVEMGLWDGPQSCSGGGQTITIDPNDPLAALDQRIKAPSCDDVAWSLFGISMAGWNALISVMAALFVGWLGFRKTTMA